MIRLIILKNTYKNSTTINIINPATFFKTKFKMIKIIANVFLINIYLKIYSHFIY